jgi:hypothetical protein
VKTQQVRYLTEIVVNQVQESEAAQIMHESNGYLLDFVIPQVDDLKVLKRPPA